MTASPATARRGSSVLRPARRARRSTPPRAVPERLTLPAAAATGLPRLESSGPRSPMPPCRRMAPASTTARSQSKRSGVPRLSTSGRKHRPSRVRRESAACAVAGSMCVPSYAGRLPTASPRARPPCGAAHPCPFRSLSLCPCRRPDRESWSGNWQPRSKPNRAGRSGSAAPCSLLGSRSPKSPLSSPGKRPLWLFWRCPHPSLCLSW